MKTMPDKSSSNSAYMAFGLLFTIIAVIALVALILNNSGAASISSSGSVTNAAPTLDTPTISATSGGVALDPIVLTAGTTTKVYIHGTITDNNGCEDIDSLDGSEDLTVALYKSDATNGKACTANNLDCYQPTEVAGDLTGCTAGGADLTTEYETDVDIQFYAHATAAGVDPDHSLDHWVATVDVTDANGGTVSASSANTEIAQLKGLSISSGSISYGGVALGGTSAEQTVTVVNEGNKDNFDPNILQTADWSCTIGTMDVGQVHWNLTALQAYASGTAVTGSAVSMNMNIAKTTDGTDSTGNFYTQLQIPSTGVGGSCTSSLVVGT